MRISSLIMEKQKTIRRGKMRKRKRKISAIFLSIMMIFSTMNVMVFADENSEQEESERIYIVEDDFEDKEPETAVEDFPEFDNYSVIDPWNKDETVKSFPRVVEDPLGENGNVMFVEDLGDSAVAVTKDIPRQEEPFTVELDFMTQEFGHATKALRILDGSTVAAEVELRNIDGKDVLGYSIPGGHEILDDDFQVDEWYNIKLLVEDRKSTRLNSSHVAISYAVFCLKKKKIYTTTIYI